MLQFITLLFEFAFVLKTVVMLMYKWKSPKDHRNPHKTNYTEMMSTHRVLFHVTPSIFFLFSRLCARIKSLKMSFVAGRKA